jgi:hypothetical protein
MARALHVLILVTAMQGHTTGTLPLFDPALAVTRAEPALTDLPSRLGCRSDRLRHAERLIPG